MAVLDVVCIGYSQDTSVPIGHVETVDIVSVIVIERRRIAVREIVRDDTLQPGPVVAGEANQRRSVYRKADDVGAVVRLGVIGCDFYPAAALVQLEVIDKRLLSLIDAPDRVTVAVHDPIDRVLFANVRGNGFPLQECLSSTCQHVHFVEIA